MQSQRTNKSSYLLTTLLDLEELMHLVRLDESLLKKLVQVCSRQLTKSSHRKSAYFFLANYKQIMEMHCKIIKNATSVNLSVHFALLFTYNLIRQSSMQADSQSQYSYAKVILKQTEQYLEISGCDLLLISTCINNLSMLHLRNHHPKKALRCCLKGISAMEDHLDRLHELKDKRRMTEDGVIFVNLLLIAKRSINKILQECWDDTEVYQHLLKIINNLGYHFSLKYLGASSIFTNKFQINPDSVYLPVYEESITETSQEIDSSRNKFEMKLAEELNNIYNILKQMRLEPEVYYIKEHLVVSKSNSQNSQMRPTQDPPPSHEPQRSVAHMEHIIIDEWDTELSILQTNDLNLQQEFQFMGYLQFRYSHGIKVREKVITEENMLKIIHTINIYDILPYEMDLKRLSIQEFIKRALKGFLMATEEGEMHILPRARPMLDPFQLTFCGEKSFVMVNHIRFRKFRVAICPIGSCDTLYLQVEFKYKQIEKLFDLKEVQHPFINAFSFKQNQQDNFAEQYKYGPLKELTILSSQFQFKIKRILKDFQIFLREEEDAHLTEMTTIVNYLDNYVYYQYTEFKEDIGQFHILKYRSNVNHIEINLKNTFRTYTPAGEDYARGTTAYSPQQFLKDFSVPLKASKNHLPAFCELILQKFSLKIYTCPFLKQEEDLYQQNSIFQVQITSKCYTRRFLPFENYLLPVTIQVISVNNEKPIGIRVTAYEPVKGTHSGLFIHVIPEYWERPLPKQQKDKNEDNQMDEKVKRSAEDYIFKKCYFLMSWMEKQGFQLIFDRLEISNRSLQIKGIPHKFIRLDEILPHLPSIPKKDRQKRYLSQ